MNTALQKPKISFTEVFQILSEVRNGFVETAPEYEPSVYASVYVFPVIVNFICLFEACIKCEYRNTLVTLLK